MKVLAVDDDHAVLDLVAHFLGIATHDNENAAPSSIAAGEARTRTRRTTPVSRDREEVSRSSGLGSGGLRVMGLCRVSCQLGAGASRLGPLRFDGGGWSPTTGRAG